MFILLTTLFLTQFISGDVQAKYEKKVIMYTNDSKTFKVPKSSKKVKWTISRKGNVSILGTSGNKKNTITIKSGAKTGVCVLKAKVGTKKYLWRVMIKKDNKISRATLVHVNKSDENIDVTIKFTNRSKVDREYGKAYFVEKFQDGKWKKMKMKTDYEYEFESIAKKIPSRDSVTEVYRLGICYNISDFSKGIYRIYVDANFAKVSYRYVLFKV